MTERIKKRGRNSIAHVNVNPNVCGICHSDELASVDCPVVKHCDTKSCEA
jgi:hypothetical protein